jgi:hypothetical protein
MYTQCIYNLFGREITKHTLTHGVYIVLATLRMWVSVRALEKQCME